MAAPPRDPRCPECHGKVSATAAYCMHCGADFESPVDADSGDRLAGGVARERGEVDRGDAAAADDDRDAGWLDPDGPLDNSLTVVVGIVVGLLVGLGSFVVLGSIRNDSVTGLLVLALWLGTTLSLARQRTLLGAVRLGCYAVAVVLVALPLVVFTGAAEGGNAAGALLLFVIAELVFGVVALVLVGVGYWAGGRRSKVDAGEV